MLYLALGINFVKEFDCIFPSIYTYDWTASPIVKDFVLVAIVNLIFLHLLKHHMNRLLRVG